MDICRDCLFSRQGGQFCVNPAVLSDYETDGGGMALSMLTEGQVMTDVLRRVSEPDCKGYSEKPFRPDPDMPHGYISLDSEPSTIDPMRDALGVEESYYRAGFWLEAVVIAGLLATIWKLTF